MACAPAGDDDVPPDDDGAGTTAAAGDGDLDLDGADGADDGGDGDGDGDASDDGGDGDGDASDDGDASADDGDGTSDAESDADGGDDSTGTGGSADDCPDALFVQPDPHPDNAAYPDPEVAAHCTDDALVVQSNGIPGFAFQSVGGDDPNILDPCNGRVGPDGVYRYHATTTFPYVLGCYRGTPSDSAGAGDPGGGGPPP
jgi:hypothetical protein